MKHLFFYALILSFVAPFTLFAQSDATLSLRPENPAPFEDVVVTLASYSFDVNTAVVTWSSNNKTLLSGLGKKTITLSLGNVVQEIPLRVEAKTADGLVITQAIVISPQSVDLVYESKESYVPPFYQGRSLPGEGSSMQITALPSLAESGKKVPESSLSYSWYVNDQNIPNASGVGKSSLRTSLNYLRESTSVRVMVRSPRGSVAEKEIIISPREAMPLLYGYDELLGTDFSRLFTRRIELTKDITLSLEPYYLSTRGLEGTATYDWFIDGLPVTPQEKSLLSLRPKENSYGVRALTVTVDQTKRRLQKAEAALQVIFDSRN